MATTEARTGDAALGVEPDDEALRTYKRGERCFFVGVFLVGSQLAGIFGVPLLLYGWRQLRRAEVKGIKIRPGHVAIIGAFAIADCGGQFLGWTYDLAGRNG